MDSQESSATPQFKSINSLALSFIEYKESICLLDVGTLVGFILTESLRAGKEELHGSPRSYGKRIPTTHLSISPLTHLSSISLFFFLINPKLTCNCEVFV